MYQVLTGIAGLLILYAGIFVYPDERKRLHNRVEDLWLVWSEKSEEYEGHILRLGKAVALRFSSLFNRYFGRRLFSQRSVMTSVVLSAWLSPMLAMFVGSLYLNVHEYFFRDLPLQFFLIWNVVLVILFIAYVKWIFGGVTRREFIEQYSKSRINYFGTFAIFVVLGPASIVVLVVLAKGGVTIWTIVAALIALTALVAIVLTSDIVSIYVTRLVLAKIQSADASLVVAAAFLIDGVIALICATYPAVALLIPDIMAESSLGEVITILAYLALLMNVTTLTPTAAYWCVSGLIGLNAFLWQSLLRPLYSLVDNRLFEQRRSLATLGAVLVAESTSQGGVTALTKSLVGLVAK